MAELQSLLLPLAAGVLLGAIFYGGLWWTVRRAVAASQPARWFIGSLLLRTSIALAGFYFVARASWAGLLVCLFFFVMARPVVTWLIRPAGELPTRPAQVPSHAP